jgi:hypothetical protein
MADPMNPIDRITPSQPLPKVTRQRTREDEQRRQGRRPPDEPEQDEPDDGMPHVDVRA